MNQSAELHRQGFLAQLEEDGELVKINGMPVIAIVDRQPRLFEMQDAGYLDKQPVNVEVLKGYASSNETNWCDGADWPTDLRGFTPVPRVTTAIIDGINKKVMSVQDCADRWILTTITLNT